jgi:phage tail protein X
MSSLKHVTTQGERWDLLAYQYYGDPLAYEAIIAANPGVPIYAILPGGLTLLIPIQTPPAPDTSDLPPWKQ